MQKDFLSALKKILADKRRRKMWTRTVSGMMAVVVFCTTYALILPGITMERETYCGLEEHTHTDECYEKAGETSKVMICDPESEAEFVIHTHDDMCYDNGNLICTLNELEEHEHSDDCYTSTNELTCDKEESEGHTHSDECYEQTLGELTCDNASAEHEHDDSCYEQTEELVCGQEESEGHTHSDECYTEQKELVCEIPEVVEHKHNDGCYQDGVLACGRPEAVKHQHTEACFEEQTVSEPTLVCGKEEHTHSEECYQKNEASGGGGGGAQAGTETTTVEGGTETTTAATEATTEGTTKEHEDLVFSYSDENISGIITLPWSEELPDDLECEPVMLTEDDDNYYNMRSSVNKRVANGDKEVDNILLYKLEWTAGENKDTYVLPEDIKPTVQFSNIETCGSDYVKGLVLSEKEDTEENSLDALVSKFSVDNDTVGDILENAANIANTEPSIADVAPEEVEVPASVIKKAQKEAKKAQAEAKDNKADRSKEDAEAQDYNYPEGMIFPVADNADEQSSVVPFGYTEGDTEYTAEYGQSEDGGITAELSETGIFAVAFASDTNYGTGGYFKRITDVNDLNSSKQYVLVSQNGEYIVNLDSKSFQNLTVKTGRYTAYSVSYREYAKVSGFITEGYGSKKVEVQRVPVALNDDKNNEIEYYRIVDPNSGDTAVTPSSYNGCFMKITPVGDGSGFYYFTKFSDTSNYLEFMNQYGAADFATTGSDSKIRLGQYGNKTSWTLSCVTTGYEYYQSDGYQTSSVTESYSYLAADSDNGIYQKPKLKSGYTYSGFEIFEYVDKDIDTKSDVAAVKDIADSTLGDEEEETDVREKPECDNFVAVSGSQEDEDTLGTDHTLSGATVKAKSDPSTSQIESQFCENGKTDDEKELYWDQRENDGKLLTDKSVIYGKDDYEAITPSDYKTGDFSVTLSALGQEWAVTEEQEAKTPIDVVLIYDMSASMMYSATAGSSTSKWEASANAINSIVKDVCEADSQNRIGIVGFSNVGMDILPIGRYSADNDKILTCTDTTPRSGYTTLKVSDSLYDGYKTDKNRKVSTYRGKTLNETGMWDRTNTQWGLQQAYDLFRQVDDTTVDLPTKGTVSRQPVIILLTDGEPTFCTYNYMNPKAGPFYGVGRSNGIEGYYAVLSANYFKNLTSIYYKRKACFYTVGMGIKKEGHGNNFDDTAFASGGYVYYRDGNNIEQYQIETDNAYMRAVLDPTDENIACLAHWNEKWGDLASQAWSKYNSSYSYSDYYEYSAYYPLANFISNDWAATSELFTKLVTGRDFYGYSTDAGALTGHTMYEAYLGIDSSNSDRSECYDLVDITGLGMTENMLNGINNPYADNYNYVDGAYFGRLSSADLKSIFDEILDKVQLKNRYDFLLKKDTSVTITDRLDSGMIVKGEPVLRMFGTNIASKGSTTSTDGKTVTYNWNGVKVDRPEDSDAKVNDKTIDLSGVTLKVETKPACQFVTFTIPESVVPAFYPDMNRNFYYEELPIRVIFRVGLSESEEEALQKKFEQYGYVDETYYTNWYNELTTGEKVAYTTVTFEPAESDPYYAGMTDTTVVDKSENPTDSATYSFKESYDAVGGVVTQLLGNNGSINITKDNTKSIEVEKFWNVDANAEHPKYVEVKLIAKGTKVSADGTSEEFVKLMDTQTLSDSNNWKYTWTRQPVTTTSNGITYNYAVYYVAETVPEGYAASYSNKDGNAILTERVTNKKETTDSDKTADETTSDESKVSAYSVGGVIFPNLNPEVDADAADATSGYVLITNTTSYKLPESGGIGDKVFTMGATASVLAVLLMIIINKRKKTVE